MPRTKKENYNDGNRKEKTDDIDYNPEINESIKACVRSLDPNGGRCLIQNTPEVRAVDFCYCVPKSLSFSLMRRVEWYWNMEYESLNLDSAYNIFRVDATLHKIFYLNYYLLLPEHDIIDQYHNTLTRKFSWTATRKSFPEIPNQNYFQYTLIPLGIEMKAMVVLRRRQETPPADSPCAFSDWTIYLYPFRDMPPSRSHLHPKFAILEGGRKLHYIARFDAPAYSTITRMYPILVKVSEIYSAWTRARPADAMKDKIYFSGRNGTNRSANKNIGGGNSITADSPRPEGGPRGLLYEGFQTKGPPKRGKRSRLGALCQEKLPVDFPEKTANKHKQKWSSGIIKSWFKQISSMGCHSWSD